jgi:hypothetical protein
VFVAAAILAGCGDDAGSDSTSTTSGSDDDASTGTDTDAGATDTDTGFPSGTPCEGSEDCGGTTTGGPAYCVAPYDRGASEPGPGTCVQTCIETDDLGRWCFDDEGCCDKLRCNGVDGFCIPRDGGSTGGTDGASGTGSTGETGSTGGTGASTATGGTG